jgi:hypothetical protein
MPRAVDAKAKAKRQKIVAAVGGVILVLLLVWRVPQVISMMNQKPAASSTPTTAPAPATPELPLPTPTGNAALVDTDVAPTPEDGQLVSFGRFVSKDPFAQQLGGAAGSSGVGGAGGGGAPRKPVKVPEPELEPAAPTAPKTPAHAPTSARITVDGTAGAVAVGAAFPSGDPVFKLVSLGKRSAKIAIEGGSYASGAATLTLKQGEPVTLVNTADGARYRVVLVATA